jgi:hypothetical protein
VRKKWTIVSVGIGTISAAITAAMVLPMPLPAPAPIDFEAELKRLTLDGQSTDPSASNGWDALVAIGTDADRIRRDIERREYDADENMKLTGREADIEPWTYDITGTWSCEPQTPRDERLIAEFWEAIASARIFERIGELRGFDVFVMDFAKRPAAEFRQSIASATPTPRLDWITGLSITIGGGVRRSLDAGDWEDATARIGDAVFLSRVLGLQADWMTWIQGGAIRERAFASVGQAIAEGSEMPPAFLRAVLVAMDEDSTATTDHVIDATRLDGIETLDVLIDMLRSNGVTVMQWVALNHGFSVRDGREAIERGHARVLAMKGLSWRDLEMEIAAGHAEASVDPVIVSGASMLHGASVYSMRYQWDHAADATRILIALALYTHDHGAPPETLDALVPASLPSLPTDPFAPDGRFRYIPGPTMRDIVVYTVGWDGKDDGGTYIPERAGRALTPDGSDGLDYVFTRDPCEAAGERP